mmetsp:Transcript_28473/g.98353  ORF Transcript_28473/g.98353 Transcript_28473/m.98353 type:complete len:341 (+) Transcript_28473:792-1814(+)
MRPVSGSLKGSLKGSVSRGPSTDRLRTVSGPEYVSSGHGRSPSEPPSRGSVETALRLGGPPSKETRRWTVLDRLNAEGPVESRPGTRARGPERGGQSPRQPVFGTAPRCRWPARGPRSSPHEGPPGTGAHRAPTNLHQSDTVPMPRSLWDVALARCTGDRASGPFSRPLVRDLRKRLCERPCKRPREGPSQSTWGSSTSCFLRPFSRGGECLRRGLLETPLSGRGSRGNRHSQEARARTENLARARAQGARGTDRPEASPRARARGARGRGRAPRCPCGAVSYILGRETTEDWRRPEMPESLGGPSASGRRDRMGPQSDRLEPQKARTVEGPLKRRPPRS